MYAGSAELWESRALKITVQRGEMFERNSHKAEYLSSSQFQRTDRKQRQCNRNNPESDNHFGFGPAFEFEMMMQRRHSENSLSVSDLEKADLKNHRKCLDYK